MKYLAFKKWWLIVILLLGTHITYSQSLCADGFLSTPDVFASYCKTSYIKKIDQGKIDLRTLSSKEQTCWRVFSDRENNPIYSKPIFDGGRKLQGKSLTFMEPLLVKEVKKNWLRVYSPDEENDLGWISSKNVILSQFAQLNEKSTPKKALILVTISDIKPGSAVIKELAKNYFYSKPQISSSNKNGKSAKKFEIYYIIKETPDMVLLSRIDKLEGSAITLKERVPGWLPRVNITPWDHRVCLELNYGSDIYDAYKNDSLPVFHDEKRYIDKFLEDPTFDLSGAKDFVMKWYKVDKKRAKPYRMRMPIIENYDEQPNVKKVAAIASLAGQEKKQADVKEKLIKAQNRIKNVNIMFIVDGTKSMKNYFPAVANGIKKIIKNNELTGANANLRFGLAVYRDYADGPKSFEITPLTTDYQSVINMATTVECSSLDSDVPEAQYNGIIKGVNESGFVKGQSNIVVLIGDAGNHSPDPKGIKIDNVVKTLVKYEINFIAFQVYRGSGNSFTVFNFDAQNILRYTAKGLNTSGVKPLLYKDKKVNNTYKLTYDTKDENADVYRMFGRYTYANNGKPMSTDILRDNIINSTKKYLENIQARIATLENIGSGQNNGRFSIETINFLRNLGFSDEEIEIFMNYGDISMKGYVSTEYYNKGYDCFYPVVFLSQTEKENLDKILGRLNRNVNHTRVKQYFKEALLYQTKSMLGDESDDVILDKSLNEIWDVILAVDFTGDPRIANTKLRDMDKLADELFDEFYDSFKASADRFVRNDFEESMFELSGQKFYWIPLNEIPGNE